MWKISIVAVLAASTTIGVALAAGHERPGSGTPGALNPDVTQKTISKTICVAGWTKTVRPPRSVTNALKKKQLAAGGYVDKNMRAYEEDHRVPLEIGGSPASPKNLWPEPYHVAWNARLASRISLKTSPSEKRAPIG